MKDLSVRVYTNENAGKIRKINGCNLSPPIHGEKTGGTNIRKEFAALNMPYARMHDCPLDNPGCRLVDVPMIFANFHDDPDDPRNYYFTQTDDYFKNCIACGTMPYYRLGVSIDHSMNKYFTRPPEDVDKWIDICSHIIRHYNEGWGGGFRFGIKYWEIWNEAENFGSCWYGAYAEYIRFYAKTAMGLKKRFPKLMIGGPAHSGFNEHVEPFIKYCAKHKVPIDFFSFHGYARDPFDPAITDAIFAVRKMLDGAGYKKTEIHINEWHWFPADWGKLQGNTPQNRNYKKRIFTMFKNNESAACLCGILSRWQDMPLDMGCYYTATSGAYGLFQTSLPTKAYYGMKAFGEIVNYPNRIKAESSDKLAIPLAGTDQTGNTAVLVSLFKTGAAKLSVKFDKLLPKSVKVRVVDQTRELEEVSVQVKGAVLSLELPSSSSVVLITF